MIASGSVISPVALPKMPCGRTISTMISTANPTAIFQRDSIKSVDHSITSPSTIPPASAPKASPIPPRITAAKIGSSSPKPSSGRTSVTAAASTPASPASPPAKIHV